MKNLMDFVPDQLADNHGDLEREHLLSERRKVVAFDLADELYGIDIKNVSAVLSIMRAMPIPRTPAHVMGVFNLRGELIPLIDLRILFKLPLAGAGADSRIVVIWKGEQKLGIIVDRVWELLRLPPNSFKATPARTEKADLKYFPEVSDVEKRMLIMIDIEKLIADTSTVTVER